MKKNMLIITTIIGILLMGSQKTHAINEEWSAVAGFVGGVLFSAAISSDTTVKRSSVTYHHNVYHNPHPVRYEYRTRCTPTPRGYWKNISERRWIPGTWYYEYDECGRSTKYWREGYWDHYQKRIWVNTYAY